MLTGRFIHLGKKYSAFVTVIALISSLSFGFSMPRVNAETTKANDLLQFTSQNHILGFRSDGVYVASSRHALTTKFLEANTVTPLSDINADVDASGKLPALSKVTYKNIWNGITAVYEGEKDSLMKSTYVVDITKKGVTPNSIRLRYNRPIQIDSNGDLQIAFEDGIMTENAPVAWQETPTGRQTVAVSFKLYRKNVIGFSLGKYLPHLPIIIDPSLTWSTFLGDSGSDIVRGITVDTSGNIFVGGDSGATWGSPVRAYTSGSDGFVAKLDSNGTLTWNTFLGGSGTDFPYAITVDTSGNIFVGGDSGATWGSPVRAYTSGVDGFVAKLDSSGTLTWNTFLGGSGTDSAAAITIDTSGNIFVGGYSTATWGSPVQAYTSGADSFVAKLDSTGALTWNTFLGGSGSDYLYAITVDTSGNIFVDGYSNATWGSPVRAYTSGFDGFVAKIDSTGTLTWNTFLGTSGNDFLYAITVDTSGNIFVSGQSNATWGSPVRSYTSGSDGFVAKLDSSGTLTWNTFLGGSGTDSANAITIDTSGNIFVGGRSNATWGSPVLSYTSDYDGLVVKLSDATASTTTSAESTATAVIVRHGGGRGSKAPGRGGTAPMIDFKTFRVISSNDFPHAAASPSTPTQQSSPAILLLQNKRDKLMERIGKMIDGANSSAVKKMHEANRERMLKRIDTMISSLSVDRQR